MDKRDILQSIIDHEGCCVHLTDADISVCDRCPLSKLELRNDGSGYKSCYAVVVHKPAHTVRELDSFYKKKAIEVLQDIVIEDMLRGDLVKDP
jgi:hypothetical protein